MKPSQIVIKKGALVPQLKGAIGSLAKLLGKMGIASISGAVEVKSTPDGMSLYFPPKMSEPSRCYVLTMSSATTLPATIGLSAITYDIASTATHSLLGTLSGGVFTFTKPGRYLAAYSASVEMILDGATTATPGHVVVQGEMRIGGTAIPSTASSTSAAIVPNFDNFVTAPGTLEMSVEDLEVETPELLTESFVTCDSLELFGDPEAGYTIGFLCDDAIRGANLVGGKLQSTPVSGTSDVTTNATVITGSLPEGTATGSMSGQALITVIRNEDGDIKILDGVTERDPTVSIYATVTNGEADCLTATLSLLKL